jgi:hypothetical protein
MKCTKKSFRTSILYLLLLLVFSSLCVYAGYKEIDLEALEKEWEKEDEEEDDWHEDTMEWNDKERKKRSNEAMNNLLNNKGGNGGGGDMNAMLNMMGNGGGQSMHMSFAQLKDDACKNRGFKESETKECLDLLAGLWSSLLKTNAIDFKAYPLEPATILFTSNGIDHHTQELKSFLFEQPEVEKWTSNSKDYYPDKETEIMSKKKAAKKKEEREAKEAEETKKKNKKKKKKSKKKKNKKNKKSKKSKKSEKSKKKKNKTNKKSKKSENKNKVEL